MRTRTTCDPRPATRSPPQDCLHLIAQAKCEGATRGVEGLEVLPDAAKSLQGELCTWVNAPFWPLFSLFGVKLVSPRPACMQSPESGRLFGQCSGISPLVCIASPPRFVHSIRWPRLQLLIGCCLLACGIGRRPLYWRQWVRNPPFPPQTAMFCFGGGVELFNNLHPFQH